MAVAEYVTKDDLEAALNPIRDRLDNIEATMDTMATKADLANMETRILQAIQRGPNSNFW